MVNRVLNTPLGPIVFRSTLHYTVKFYERLIDIRKQVNQAILEYR